MATPVDFTSPVPPCTPTAFNWTGGTPPFRLNVTAADPTTNSGLIFGISFDGLQERGFTFSVPFPVGTSVSFNVLSNSTSSSVVPPSIITSHFTVGGEQGSDFSCTLGIQNEVFSTTNAGGSISLSGTKNSTESCDASSFTWTGGTPPFHARFALKSAPNGNLNIIQDATIDVTGITRNGITLNVPYDTGATIGVSVSEDNARISTDLSTAQPIFMVAGGTSDCFLQASNVATSSSTNGNPFNLGRTVGPSVGGFVVLLIVSSFVYRLFFYRRQRVVPVRPVSTVEVLEVERRRITVW